jgi:hypothetical protein
MNALKNITILFVALVILGVGYMYIANNKKADTPVAGGTVRSTSNTLAAAPIQSDVGKELLNTLLQLRSLSLDDKIFSDQLFLNLVDFSVEIAPQPIGRFNPFAPIGR